MPGKTPSLKASPASASQPPSSRCSPSPASRPIPRTIAGDTRSSGTASARSASRTAAPGGCRAAGSRTSRSVPRAGADRRAARGRSAVLDGEVVALRDDGRPSFQLIQRRMGLTDPAVVERRVGETPVDYIVFDLLHLDGASTRELPYAERRELLAGLGLEGPRWRRPTPPRRRRRRAAGGRAPPGAGGRGREAARQPLPARQAQRRVDQGARLAATGVRDRRATSQARAAARGRSARCWSATTTGARPSSARRAPAADLRRRSRLGAEAIRYRLPHPRAEAAPAPRQPLRRRRAPGPEGAAGGLVRARAASARSTGPSGPMREPCASPPSRACGTTRTRARSSGNELRRHVPWLEPWHDPSQIVPPQASARLPTRARGNLRTSKAMNQRRARSLEGDDGGDDGGEVSCLERSGPAASASGC